MALIGNQTGETGSYRGLGSGVVKGASVTMTEDGTAVSIFANIGASASGDTWQAMIYTAAGSLVDSSSTKTGISGAHSWQEFTGFTASLSSSTEYIIAVSVSADVFDGISFAAADTYDGRTASDGAVDPPASSVTWGADSARDYQIYLNYTAGGATAAITGTATAGINEDDVVAGGKTIIITLTGDTFVSDTATAPSVRGVGAFGSGTTSFTAAVPTGGSAPVAGDAMYIIMESTDSTTTAGTPTTPTDWDKLFENTIASGSSSEPAVSTLTIFGKIATSSESNVTVSGVGNHCAGAMIVIQGHGLSAITDTVVGSPTDHGTSTTNVLAPSINVTANSMILTVMGLGDDANDTTNVSGVTNSNLASITERIDQTVSTGSGGGVGIYTSTCAGTSTGTTEWDHDSAASSQSLQLGIPPPPSAFANARQDIIDGLDSAQSEGTGWNAEVRDNLAVTTVVRTSSTVVTITLSAQAAYNITAQETITVTVPASALTGASPIVGDPTFTVDPSSLAVAVTSAAIQPSASTIVLNQAAVLTDADIEPAGQDISLTWTQNWFLTVDSTSIQIDGQDVTLAWQNDWTIAVDTASFQIDGQAIPLNVGIVVTQADIQPAGQDITLAWTQNWFLAVDAATFQIDGQDITLAWTQNWFLAVDKADIKPEGQDISLIWSASLDIAVDSAALSLSGSAVDLTLTTRAAEAPSGGWVESATDIRIARERARLRKELEEEQEREELADRLERVLVQEGSLTQAQADLIRLRGIAAKYSRDDLPNRARRALAFAERAQSEFSTRLALREIRRLEEEEEMAVLLLMTLD